MFFMRITHRTTGIVMSIAIGVLLGSVISVLSGILDPPGAPSATSSYTLEDIYNRLNTGTSGSTITFTEPLSGPTVGTMHTLNDIMGIAPAVDDANGAAVGDVLVGKTFWGRKPSGGWGPKTGNVTAGANVSGAEGSKTFTIPDGLYSGSKTATAASSALVAENIKSGTTIFGVAGTYGGSGGSASVPRTGQILCYDVSTNLSKACDISTTGQDGANILKGVAWPNPRFTASNGTVRDNLTGLTWLQKADYNSTSGTSGTATWQNALTFCNALGSGQCGLTDGSTAGQWRLPNRFELTSLLDLAYADPALSNDVGTNQWPNTISSFTNVQTTPNYSYYWSSTTSAGNTGSALVVGLDRGFVLDGGKSGMYYVWPVRGGQ
jgi:Protein of unknown function (DUF1566)